jgi:hypothetical protein
VKAKSYGFKSKIWKYKGPASWHFVTLPKGLAIKIRKNHGYSEEGWGRLQVAAQVGESNWKTAIWYDSKAKSYLLPIKAPIRKVQNIKLGKIVQVTLFIQEENFRHLI